MIKYIVFDFDGTIADSFNAMKEVVKKEFKDISEEDFELLKNEGIKGMMKKKSVHIWKLPSMAIKVKSKLKNKKNIKLFPEVIEVLGVLSRSYKLGILSSNTEENIIQNLEKNNIWNLFDFIFPQSSIFGKHKDMKKMCDEYRINPSEIIYIGDEDRDIVASKKAEIKNIAVTWGYNSKKRLKKVNPDFIATSPKKILQIICSF